MTSGRGLRRAAVIAWIALIVIVAIWTERHIADHADAPPVEPIAQRAPAAPPRPRRPAMPPSAPAAAEPPLRLEGHVIDPDGRDAEGVIVGLAIDRDVDTMAFPWVRATHTPVAHATSDAAGRFVFDAVEPGSYVVTATAGALVAEPIRYTAGDARRPVVLRLAAGASVTVTVTDPAGAPVPAARVEVRARESRATAETDAQGQATVAPIAGSPGSVELMVGAPGFAPGYRGVWLRSASHDDVIFTLYRGVPLSGRVVDDHREPIAGARISLRGRATFAELASDNRGEFVFPALVRDQYTLVVAADGRVPARTTVSVDRAAVSGVEIAMASGAMITGLVVDAGHRAVPHATVTAHLPGMVAQTTSDAGGNFELRGIPPGRLWLRAETGAAQSGQISTTISAASDAPDVEIVLEFAGAIAGIVVDDHGAPLAGMPVTAYPNHRDPRRRSPVATYGHAISDDTGAFVVAGLADTSYFVLASHDPWQSAGWPPPGATLADSGDRNVRLVVPSDGRAVGRLVDELGAPISSASVALASRGATTDRDGAFEIRDIAPGSHDVNSMVANVVTRVRQAVEIRPGETTDLGTLTAPRSRSRALAGRVVDTAGVPIGNVRVELGVIRPPPVDEDDPPGGFHAHRSIFTSPDGLFRILDIPPTPMLARATDPAYRDSAMITMPTAAACPGDPPAITLVLPPRDAR